MKPETIELLMWLTLFLAFGLALIFCLCRWDQWFSSAEEHFRRRWRAWRQFLRRKRVGRPSFIVRFNPWSDTK